MSVQAVSIAMATYNGARFLREQLDSFATQTRPPDELIACDDGSSDETLAIIDEFARTAPFLVKVHRNPVNLGVSPNFAQALSMAAGDIIFVSDQDDVWLPRRIERFLSAFEEHRGALVVADNAIVSDAHLRPIGDALSRTQAAGFSSDRLGAGSAMALRREFLDIAVPFGAGPAPYDSWITQLANSLQRRFFITESLHKHRLHERNATKRFKQSSIRRNHAEWQQLIAERVAINDRLQERMPLIVRMGSSTPANLAIANNAAHISALQARISILRLPAPLRVLPVARLFARGAYQRFSGWRSAVKDLVR